MANWCFSKVRVNGSKEQVKELYQMMKNLEDMKEPLVENGFGTSYYANLVHVLGGDCENISCCGFWKELKIIDDNTIGWSDETKYHPVYDVFELIKNAFPDLEVWFITYGCDFYISNDADGIYFPERFWLMFGEETDYEDRYYPDIQSMLKDISTIFNRDISTEEQFCDILDEFVENDDTESFCFWVELKIVDYCH